MIRKRNDYTLSIISICRDWVFMARALFISSVVSPSLLLQFFASSLMLVHYRICLLALKLGVSALKGTTRRLCRVSSGTLTFRVVLFGIRLRSSLTRSHRAFFTLYWETL